MTDLYTKYYDTHTLFIKCGQASIDQIYLVFNLALNTYKNNVDSRIECNFYVNLVETRENRSFGIAFVFVTNSTIYHMLIGKNPDGTERVEYHDDPKWIIPAEENITIDTKLCGNNINQKLFMEMDWSVLMKMDEEYEQQLMEIKNRYVCPKIAVALPPLMTLPPYAENEYLNVDRAIALSLDAKFMPNILKCKQLPVWITKNDIKQRFILYASDSQTLHARPIKGRSYQDSYPFININENRTCFVIFDPATHDARFALHMMKKTIISNESQSVTLFFRHSYRGDCDMLGDQKSRPYQRNSYSQKSNRYQKQNENTTKEYEENNNNTNNNPSDIRGKNRNVKRGEKERGEKRNEEKNVNK